MSSEDSNSDVCNMVQTVDTLQKKSRCTNVSAGLVHGKTQAKNVTPVEILPDELLALIISYMPSPRDLCSIEETCQWWRKIMHRQDGGIPCWNCLTMERKFLLRDSTGEEAQDQNPPWWKEARKKLNQPGSIDFHCPVGGHNDDDDDDATVPLSLVKAKELCHLASVQPTRFIPPDWEVISDTYKRTLSLCPTADCDRNRVAKTRVGFPCTPNLTKAVSDGKKWTLSTCIPYYFEIEVLSLKISPESECLAIGLGTTDFSTNGLQPGWRSSGSSVGYHGDDGCLFINSGIGEPFGRNFGKEGDVVGCGLDPIARHVFFTLNGKLVGIGANNVAEGTELFPLVGVGTYALLHWNFGMEPFKYDLWAYDLADIAEEMLEKVKPFHWTNFPPLWYNGTGALEHFNTQYLWDEEDSIDYDQSSDSDYSGDIDEDEVHSDLSRDDNSEDEPNAEIIVLSSDTESDGQSSDESDSDYISNDTVASIKRKYVSIQNEHGLDNDGERMDEEETAGT